MGAHSSDRYYRDRHASTRQAVALVLGELLELIPPVGSAVDLGCGVGTWLEALLRRGVSDVLGVEGKSVRRERLVIPETCFLRHDLATPLVLGRRFDLAISLEVAEHLPPGCADDFTGVLTDLSDIVLFSAAVPLQGGRGHLNEQWPAYWAERFAARGWVSLDVLRPRLWNRAEIPYWYRQNTIVYVRRDRVLELDEAARRVDTREPPLALVHPEMYLGKLTSIRRTARQLRRAVTGRVLRRPDPV